MKPRDIEIDPNDPFANDSLERVKEIENLTPIVLNFKTPLVFAIDSAWGTGKTTFVKLWNASLKHQGKQSIYFNAWQTDYAKDPLIVLVAELDKWVKNNNSVNPETWQKAKKLLFGITKGAVVAGVKAATLGGLDIAEQYEEIAADFTSAITGDLVDSFNEQSEAIAEFKKIVEQVLIELGDNQKNLVIFIDELDRCRPTYAIELLERIKHLYDIERLAFVLSIDISQLEHSVRAVYGNGFEGRKYLQRFIDLDYSLKEPNIQQYIRRQFALDPAVSTYPYFSARQPNEVQTQINYIVNCCSFLENRFNLKLRDINLILMRIHIVLCTVSSTDSQYHHDDIYTIPYYIFLLSLKKKNAILYEKYKESPGVADEVIKFFCGQDDVIKFIKNQNNSEEFDIFCFMVGSFIASVLNQRIRYDELLAPYKALLNIPADQLYADVNMRTACNVATRIIEIAGRININHKYTIERIELLQRINIEH